MAAGVLLWMNAWPGDERNSPGLRGWAPRMEIGEEMKRKVQERWREYGFV